MSEASIDQSFMRRCFYLARLGSYHVKSNPQVGSVITYQDRIIGEGYHRKYGGAHAEIEALNSIRESDRSLLSKSHLYVSLEPCFHTGKTPPCVEAILAAGIPEVTICNLDPNPKTHGKSLEKLRSTGIKVNVGVLSEEGLHLNRRFFVNQLEKNPLVVLKWAQSKDGYIGKRGQQVWLSNELAQLEVHRWREEIDGILVGTDTAIVDNPLLTNRKTPGRSPQRFVLDRQGRIPLDNHLVDDELSTTIITSLKNYPLKNEHKKVMYVHPDSWEMDNILRRIYENGCNKLLIEGGAALHKSMIKNNLWHEARVLHTSTMLNTGIRAPLLSGQVINEYHLQSNRVLIINNLNKSKN